ncbi:hypothetical protein COCOBI_15-1060 [Coccomyxa sp. Obi]|nr:hypothetical protein COCOBI_15-1060 [Coccomyxa sp. Obi]
MPLRQPEQADARGIAAAREQQQSAEVAGSENHVLQPHTIRNHRKLLQGALISTMAAEQDGTETADGTDLCKTSACIAKQNRDSLNFAGALGGIMLGACVLCCGCCACYLKLFGRKDDPDAQRDYFADYSMSEMWAHDCKRARPPAPTKPGKKRLPAKSAAKSIAVVVKANTAPAAVLAEATTISIESSTVEVGGAGHSSKRESTVEMNTLEKCTVHEDSLQQHSGQECPPPKGGTETIPVVVEADTSPATVPAEKTTISIERSTIEEAAANNSSVSETPVEEDSVEQCPGPECPSESAVELSTLEKCGVEEDSAEQCPGEESSGRRNSVGSGTVEQSSAAETTAEQSSAEEGTVKEGSDNAQPGGSDSEAGSTAVGSMLSSCGLALRAVRGFLSLAYELGG